MTATPWPGACGSPTARLRAWATIIGIGCWAVVPAAVRADDDQAVDAADLEEPQRPANRPGHWVDLGAMFDTNVLRQRGLHVQPSPTPRKPRPGAPSQSGPTEPPPDPPLPNELQKLGDKRLAALESIFPLSEQQRHRLRLAIESDRVRLSEEIEVFRRKYRDVEINLPEQNAQWQQFHQDVARCQGLISQFLKADSLFVKSLATTLDAEQRALLAAEADARQAMLWKTLVAAALLKFDDQLGLDQRQFTELERLLLEKRGLLREDGFARHRTAGGSVWQLQHIVWVAVAEVEDRHLRDFLSPRQVQLISQFAAQGKQIRHHLKVQGFIH